MHDLKPLTAISKFTSCSIHVFSISLLTCYVVDHRKLDFRDFSERFVDSKILKLIVFRNHIILERFSRHCNGKKLCGSWRGVPF